MKSVFNQADTAELLNRIEKLATASVPTWGIMNVAQMLAHCNVTYEMVFDTKHAKPKGFKRWMLKAFVKNVVVSEKPYSHNSRTAEQFLVSSEQDFEVEKTRLVAYIKQTQELGAAHFEKIESHSFGYLTETEWNNMFYKHLNHHLTQFGV